MEADAHPGAKAEEKTIAENLPYTTTLLLGRRDGLRSVW